MALLVARTPMNPAVYRAVWWTQVGSLVVGIALLVVYVVQDTDKGFAENPVLWLLILCTLGFFGGNSVCRVYYPPDDEQIAALALVGTDNERAAVARWSTTPTAVLQHLARDPKKRVSNAARRSLDRRSALQ